MKKSVLIAGGGASGMAAAIRAAERGFSVTVLEKKEQLGKKLLTTGNGRCNLSNRDLSAEHFRGSHTDFLTRFLSAFTASDSEAFFRSLGLFTAERNGYVYPASMQASSVLFALSERMKALGVRVLLNTPVLSAKKEGDRFLVTTPEGERASDALILSMGSPAGVRDRVPYNGYALLKGFGHTVIPPRPALVPLYGNNGSEKGWAGVRIQGSASFGGRSYTGEIQLTEKGISGIPVFQLSRFVQEALAEGKVADVRLSFLPEIPEETLLEELKRAADSLNAEEKIEEYLRGWLPRKLIPAVLGTSGIRPVRTVGDLSEEERETLVFTVKNFPYRVALAGPAEEAQVFMGGLELSELRDTFESRLVPGLFVTGELNDADGECGGYNLHFAFGSGLIAGENVPGGGL